MWRWGNTNNGGYIGGLFSIDYYPQNIPKVNQIKVSKVEFWHVIFAKLHKFPTHLTINRADIVPCVVVVCNKEGIFSIERGWHKNINPSRGFCLI